MLRSIASRYCFENQNQSMKVLVTGAAGFVGCFVARDLLARGDTVVGLDNLNDYYDVSLKEARLNLIRGKAGFSFVKSDVADFTSLEQIFKKEKFDRVVHLAAQAGVRYSLKNPQAYVQSNLVGFVNILECCRHYKIQHLVYASSSSVYGMNKKMPFAENDNVDHPVSLYAATKKSNELMAHTYSHLYQLPTTGLRFFTVYGPWGRPDMSPIIFANKISRGEVMEVFNYGNHGRDFTYIDDIVAGVVHVLDKLPVPNIDWSALRPDPASSTAPYRLYNIGSHRSVKLMDYIALLEKHLGKTTEKKLLPMQPGDVENTYADIAHLLTDFNYRPDTSLDEGIKQFADWYKQYYKGQ